MIGKPGSGRSTTGSFRSRTRVVQARPFLPLMFIASEPHTPSRQDLRSDRLVVLRLDAQQHVEQHAVADRARAMSYLLQPGLAVPCRGRSGRSKVSHGGLIQAGWGGGFQAGMRSTIAAAHSASAAQPRRERGQQPGAQTHRPRVLEQHIAQPHPQVGQQRRQKRPGWPPTCRAGPPSVATPRKKAVAEAIKHPA
jgi:hypothetical protein